MARVDLEIYGLNKPHSSEIFTLLVGKVYVGFITSIPENNLFSKVLNKGDSFVFPKGLIHFVVDIGKTKAIGIAALGSQNLGFYSLADAVLGTNPNIFDDVLAKAFQLDKKIVDWLQSQF
ncbi:putative germin-like protein 2-1 [Dioscorea cayenensis subsp. rotundata]|uniref:Germin-like protein n=1 Tax=Dioscorea cayennensis subsp. rotundata TaxID=55577 RepID=A0AB40CNZ1_DIOCR|nr:putative germin-like protein 2-1 [Dioscorea cayenensis subsp. rotundata]